MSKHEEIKKVAYEIFEKSGRTHGGDFSIIGSRRSASCMNAAW
ncbi:MAG: DUF2934 domain-containing protein [Desulfobacterales bacterium]|nr:DUF2934 domain-containing protein [Desulfobacterales bacterium]